MNNYYRSKRRRPFIFRIIGMGILGLIGAGVLAFVFAYFVLLLWNWLMPEIFGITSISFWQAVGIVVLARLIFGGIKHHEGHRCEKPYDKFSKFKRWKTPHLKNIDKKDHWKNIEKWQFYDDFWSEEGEKAFNDYVERKSSGTEQESSDE